MKKVLSKVDREKQRMLDVKPYQEWIEKQIQPDKYGSINNLSEILGISNKKLNGIKVGKAYGSKSKIITHVEIDLVDKSAVMTGNHISDIYEDYYDWPI